MPFFHVQDPLAWTHVLFEHTPEAGPVGWVDAVVGYDFGLLRGEAVIAWAGAQPADSPAVQALAEAESHDDLDVGRKLLAACREATGRSAFPGSSPWLAAQDRWRVALLREALSADLTPDGLAEAVAGVYEQVGCPEDMLHLWRPAGPHGALRAELGRIEAFLHTRAALLGLAS